MNSEEDTFRKLQKYSPNEVLNKIFSLSRAEWYIVAHNDELREEFLNSCHWTTAEWHDWLKANG